MSEDLYFIKKIDFLKSIGSDKVNHAGQNLLEHLIGTSEKLKELGAKLYLQDAGLFHSVYGTTYFMPDQGLVDDRQIVIDLIGKQAEEIAYWFCILDKPRTEQILKFKGQLKKDLLMLDFANEEDIANSRMMTMEEAYDL
tara:strand:+ start:346 stop:765 length:420 start_codon:yes stop_codon:yes gene_type:complete